jgi:hypothetical protein
MQAFLKTNAKAVLKKQDWGKLHQHPDFMDALLAAVVDT